jgi:hypothetical protein
MGDMMEDSRLYSDEQISLLLENAFIQNKDIEVLTPMIANDWKVGKDKFTPKNDTLTDNLKEFRNHRSFRKNPPKKVIVPMNIGDDKGKGHHWVLACLTYGRDGDPLIVSNIDYFDPLGESIPLKISSKFRNVFGPDDFFIVNSSKKRFQKDGDSCGPWIVEIAKAWGKNSLKSFNDLAECDITQKRKEHQKILQSKQSKITLELPKEEKEGYFKRRNRITNTFKGLGKIEFVGKKAEKAVVTIQGEKPYTIEATQEKGKEVLSTCSNDPQILKIMVRTAFEMIKASGEDPLKHKIKIETGDQDKKEMIELLIQDEKEEYQEKSKGKRPE